MTADPPPPTAVRRWVVRVAGALLCLAAAAVAVVLARAAEWTVPALTGGRPTAEEVAHGALSLLLVTWTVAPLVSGAWLVRLVERTWPRALGVAALGAVALTAFTGAVIEGFLTSDSSTAVLIFLFLPLYLWVGLGLTIGVAALVDTGLARRRRHRDARAVTPEPRT